MGLQICKNTGSIGSCPIPRKYREKKIPSLLTSDCRLQTGSMATTKKEPPSNKEVCLLFLQNKTTGNFEFTNSSGGKCFSKGQSGICPGCKTVLVYRNGYSNPFKHLLNCFARNELSKLYELFWANSSSQDTLLNHGYSMNQGGTAPRRAAQALKTRIVTKADEELFLWIQLIVMRNVPLSHVQDQIFRQFAAGTIEHKEKGDGPTNYSVDTVKNTILHQMRIPPWASQM